MPLFASGVGSYGSVGGAKHKGSYSAKAAGNSDMMPAKSMAQMSSVAQQHTQNFIANGKKMARGASGNSRIHVKA
jgi:hypothetical protein